MVTVYAFGRKEPSIEKRNSFILAGVRSSEIKIKITAFETEILSGTSLRVPDQQIKYLCIKKGIRLSDISRMQKKKLIYS